MNKNKITLVVKYLNPTLILSYFFIHNIFLVLIGISFSLYLINYSIIHNFIRSLNITKEVKKSSTKLNENDKAIKVESIQKQLKKEESKLTLVDRIEELGYIPSIEKNNDSNAA